MIWSSEFLFSSKPILLVAINFSLLKNVGFCNNTVLFVFITVDTIFGRKIYNNINKISIINSIYTVFGVILNWYLIYSNKSINKQGMKNMSSAMKPLIPDKLFIYCIIIL